MADKPEQDISFNEALKRIANTPKDAVPDKRQAAPKASKVKKRSVSKRKPIVG